jgi:hypothetical protein
MGMSYKRQLSPKKQKIYPDNVESLLRKLKLMQKAINNTSYSINLMQFCEYAEKNKLFSDVK